MKRTLVAVLGIAIACAGVFFFLTMPHPLSDADLPDHPGDIANGEHMFWAGGCASCHAAPGADDEDLKVLAGGLELPTPFGTFNSPNISTDDTFGIGDWSTLDFVNAMARGLSPDNEHYYPAFPYPHYQNIRLEDLIDLKAFMDTLPPSRNSVDDHDLPFPYSVRRGLGLWKWRYLEVTRIPDTPMPTETEERGRYLVRGPGHCSACHTPRDAYGGEVMDRFLAGAPDLESGESGGGRIPNITPHEDGLGGWSARDIAYSLETGFDPDFDSFGGSMVAVQENMARLPAEDREAMAAYLKSITPYPSDKQAAD